MAAAKAEQGGAPALSPATRLLCAQRLLACAAHVPAAAASGGQGEPAAKKAKVRHRVCMPNSCTSWPSP